MKNYKLVILIKLIFLCVFSASAFSAEKLQPLRVIDGGTDGDERFYTVYCPDGKRASIVKRFKIGEVCTKPSYASEDICKNWSVDEAAIESCK